MNRRIRFIAFLIITTVFTACQPDSTVDDPSVNPRDKFVGNWFCRETSKKDGVQSFNVTISASATSSTGLLIDNFYNYKSAATATCSGYNITIPTQEFCNCTISGSGYIDQNKTTINWTYYVNDGQRTDSCTAIFTKR